MFGIGWEELLIIAVVSIIVIGPEDLPGMMRTIGRYAARIRSMASGFRAQFDEALRELEPEEIRKEISKAGEGPVEQVNEAIEGVREAGRTSKAEVGEQFEKPVAELASEQSPPAPSTAPKGGKGKGGSRRPRPATAGAGPAAPAKELAQPSGTKRSSRNRTGGKSSPAGRRSTASRDQ